VGVALSCAVDNIYRVLRVATDQEISDGLAFYPGANGLCRLLANLSSPFYLTPHKVAGAYAALSPLNTWDTNVANVLDVIRLGRHARVNTTSTCLRKAVDVLGSRTPDDIPAILGGRKITNFYLAMAFPDNRDPVPVDRHLVCAALGLKITDNVTLSRLIANKTNTRKIEEAYQEAGVAEGVGNRLASVVWFVQRRLSRGQLGIVN
jgi:hypothetical protein